LYSMGVNEDGTKSNYKSNLHSNGAGLIGISSNFGKNIKLQYWNIIFDNVFNASLVQLDYLKPLDKKLALIAAIQAIGEFAINNGGNSNPSDTYMQKHHKAFTFGAKLGLNINQLECTFNYNRITADGRYLMPREWGRDPFFTFMPRERNEGLGDVNAVNMSIKYNLPKQHLKSTFTLGYYHLPDVKNYKLNKYGLPSYTQMNLDIRYAFRNLLNGLEVQALFVRKFDVGNTYHEYKYIFNKVDMNLYNLVLNYYF
ncbi:MAG: hypothetical protein KBA06_00595, partial [Saprospiraceae bacterium]|nr:hypothetical protein [Saprospiraceae bacterium]